MPAKFKESSKVLVNREAKKYRVVHYYLKNTSTEELLEAIEKATQSRSTSKVQKRVSAS